MTNYNDRLKIVAERIKEEREHNKWSKVDLLAKIYMAESSHKTITAWENGTRMPDLASLARMAEVFHCDIGYLLGDYDERTRVSADIVKETGLSAKAVEKILKMPSFLKITLSDFICAESFGNIIQGIFTYKQMIQDVVKLAEDPSMEYDDFQRRKIVADAMEFQTTKELGKVFTDITENMFSCSDAIVKVDGGYKRVITYKEKKDG